MDNAGLQNWTRHSSDSFCVFDPRYLLWVQPHCFDPLEGACLVWACIFLSLADGSCEQIDKNQVRDLAQRWCMCLQAQKRMVSIRLHGPKMLSDVTNQEICCIYRWWNTTALCRECRLMLEQLNLSRCNLSRRNFSHRTVSDSVCRCEAVVGVRKQQLSDKSLKGFLDRTKSVIIFNGLPR